MVQVNRKKKINLHSLALLKHNLDGLNETAAIGHSLL